MVDGTDGSFVSLARLPLVGVRCGFLAQVPLLGWEIMREFFQAFCGAPELLLLTSRRFQQTAFQKELREVTNMGETGCVACVRGQLLPALCPLRLCVAFPHLYQGVLRHEGVSRMSGSPAQ